MLIFVSYNAQSQTQISKTEKDLIIYLGQFPSLAQDNIDSIASFQFGDNFAVHLVTDDQSNFFLLDLSLLNGEFERNYFIKEVYKNQLFIQFSHGMPADRAWVIADSKIASQNVITLLADFFSYVKSMSGKMTASEKEIWLATQTN